MQTLNLIEDDDIGCSDSCLSSWLLNRIYHCLENGATEAFSHR